MQKGDVIRVAYAGKLKEGGQELDKELGSPVIIGAGWVLPGIEEALQGMKVGDKKSVEIPPEKAFGPREANKIKLVPESEFKRHGTTPVPGMWVNADDGIRGHILSVSSGRVKVDFNHPLAGKVVVYDLEVKEKLDKPEEKIAAICEFYSKQPKEKFEVTIQGKEAVVKVPLMINPVWKKRMAEESMQYGGVEKVAFLEVFEKGAKEQ